MCTSGPHARFVHASSNWLILLRCNCRLYTLLLILDVWLSYVFEVSQFLELCKDTSDIVSFHPWLLNITTWSWCDVKIWNKQYLWWGWSVFYLFDVAINYNIIKGISLSLSLIFSQDHNSLSSQLSLQLSLSSLVFFCHTRKILFLMSEKEKQDANIRELGGGRGNLGNGRNTFFWGRSFLSVECRTHSWTRSSSVASGSLVRMSHAVRVWEQYSSAECRTHSWTRGSSVDSGSLSGSYVARSSSVLYLTSIFGSTFKHF